MIKAENLKKVYGDRTVLDIESLEIKKGECVVLTGHNGSGKSTLMKIIAGTLKPSHGSVKTKGEIYYLPQNSLPFNKSVRKNILYCLKGNKRSKNELCEKLLEAFNLKHLESKNAKNLSGGECQRLALCRVLSRKADIILLDEPTSAADSESRKKVNRLIAEYHIKTGCTLIMTSHTDDLPEGIDIKVIKLADGRIIKEEKDA